MNDQGKLFDLRPEGQRAELQKVECPSCHLMVRVVDGAFATHANEQGETCRGSWVKVKTK